MIKVFKRNTLGRDFVVGDIHGCYVLLMARLKELKFNPKIDRLFSVGDLCDRGPESPSILVWMEYDWFFPVAGNHENFVIDYMEGDLNTKAFIKKGHCSHGGAWFYGLSEDKQLQIYRYFKSLPLMIEVETSNDFKVGIIHSELCFNDWNITKQLVRDQDSYANTKLQYSRSKHEKKDKTLAMNIDMLYVGHTTVRNVLQLGNTLYLDTGACFSNLEERMRDGRGGKGKLTVWLIE